MTINRYSDGRIYKHKNKGDLQESATERISKSKRNKYNAKKCNYNGITFDSKKEMNMYVYLKRLENDKFIDYFKHQVKYVLQDKYKNPLEKNIRDIKMILDFVVYKDEIEYIIDCKSEPTLTDVFLLKKKLFEYKFNKPIYCIYSNEGVLKLLLKNLS